MSHPFFLHRGVFAFSLLQNKPNGLPHLFPLESMITRMGFIFPLQFEWANLIDYQHRGDSAFREAKGALRSLILSANGHLREVIMVWKTDEEGVHTVEKNCTLLPFDNSTTYARCIGANIDEIVTMYCNISDSAEQVVERLGRLKALNTSHYKFATAEQICLELQRRGCTEEFAPERRTQYGDTARATIKEHMLKLNNSEVASEHVANDVVMNNAPKGYPKSIRQDEVLRDLHARTERFKRYERKRDS